MAELRGVTRREHRQRPVRQPSLAAQTEEILASRLIDGELAPGDQLPCEPALAEEFGVSRATVRAVIGDEAARRAVRWPQITEPLFTFLEDVGGVRTTSQIARVEACLGSDVDHPASSLGADVAVLRIDETGYTDDPRPIWHSRTWFPPGAMNFELIGHRTGAFA